VGVVEGSKGVTSGFGEDPLSHNGSRIYGVLPDMWLAGLTITSWAISTTTPPKLERRIFLQLLTINFLFS